MSKRSKIEKYLEKQKPEIDKIIKKYLPQKASKKWLDFIFGKPRYFYNQKAAQEVLIKPIQEFLGRGGKRWRPALFLLVIQAIGGNLKKLKNFLVIPELCHEGCLSKDSYILKNPGEQVKINQIKKGDYVYTMAPDGRLSRNKVLAKKFTGTKKVYKLITRNREIEASENHPFLVITKKQPVRYKITSAGRKKINTKLKRGDIKKLADLLNKDQGGLYNALAPQNPALLPKSDFKFIFNWLDLKIEKSDYIPKQTEYESPEIGLKWKPLEKLKKGDNIIVLNKIPDEGKSLKLPQPPKDPIKDRTILPKETSEEFCQLVGYILGDGSISIDKKSSRLQLCPSNNPEEISAYSSLFSKVFSYQLRRHKKDSGLHCCSFKVCWLLDKLGLHKRATKKTLPNWIFVLPEQQKLAFLRGYLDSDGWVDKEGRTYFSSSNKILIKKLKLLLDNLGFTTSHIYYKRNRNLWKISKKKYSNQWSIGFSNPHQVLKDIGTEKSLYKKGLERKQRREGNTYRYLEDFPSLPIDFPIFRIDKVREINFIGKKPVYDLMIENSHNFIANNIVVHNSIIVDDIEDNSELRRGKLCLHKIFGTDVAINAGNFLYFLPLITLIKNKNKFKPEVISRAYETCIQEMINIHLGQGTDIYWHRGKAKKISEKEYFQMCAFKTGCLARLAAKLAVILSEGSEKLAEKLGQMAEAIGIGFQIQDDILDIILEGKERKKFGKSFGNDIKEGKRTLMVIHTLQKANKKDKKRLLEILDKHTDDLKERKEAIEIIKKYGSIEYARKVARKIIKESWKDAEKLLPKSKAKEKLEEFVNYLIERRI
ncbi:MAG: polyprenyl synthetase family protein [Patescibacteria group bacterium]|nr:polyprenyl synthetase family protein [Patescibacteria group bacterium]